MNPTPPITVTFVHTILEGTPYAVGQQQARQLKNDPQRLQALTPHLPFLAAYTPAEARAALAYIEKHCPGLREEIEGAADELKIPAEEMAFVGGKSPQTGRSPIPVAPSPQCSQLAVLPAATGDGHLYAGQNIDSGLSDLDLRLCTTRVTGKPAHLGFSDMIFGRVQGLNAHGLCVTSSWGAPMMWPPGEGLPYFAVIRALLDRGQDVASALETLAGIPVAWCTNLILSDSSGRAALVEVAGAERHVTQIGGEWPDQFLYATNHYLHPGLRGYLKNRRRESVARRQTIAACLEAAAPRIGKETLRGLLSTPAPEGVCMPYYSTGLGTLWSMIFDVTAKTVDICLGSPASPQNPWRTFDLQGAPGVREFPAHLPDEAAAPGFYDCLPLDAPG